MQKAADAAYISVLFFSAGANFWAILGHFWAIFLWQNMPLCYLNHLLQLCHIPNDGECMSIFLHVLVYCCWLWDGSLVPAPFP